VPVAWRARWELEPPAFRSVDSRVAVRPCSDQSVTSGASLSAVRPRSENRDFVRPRGSQRGSHFLGAWHLDALVLVVSFVTGCTVKGMARVRSGQAPAWPLVSGRVPAEVSGSKHDFACTLTRHLNPLFVALRSQSCLLLEGRARTLSGPSPDASRTWTLAPSRPTSRTRTPPRMTERAEEFPEVDNLPAHEPRPGRVVTHLGVYGHVENHRPALSALVPAVRLHIGP
jgi:hypothetical protein